MLAGCENKEGGRPGLSGPAAAEDFGRPPLFWNNSGSAERTRPRCRCTARRRGRRRNGWQYSSAHFSDNIVSPPCLPAVLTPRRRERVGRVAN